MRTKVTLPFCRLSIVRNPNSRKLFSYPSTNLWNIGSAPSPTPGHPRKTVPLVTQGAPSGAHFASDDHNEERRQASGNDHSLAQSEVGRNSGRRATLR